MIVQHNEQTHFESMSTDRYTVIQLGRLSLLIPQCQVHTLEPATDVQPAQDEGVGWLEVGGARLPVYCLSENLQPIPAIPADRTICAVFDIGGKQFGLLCNQVSLFEPIKLDIKPVPDCMCTRSTPLHGLVLYGETVLCITFAQDLLACVNEDAQTLAVATLFHHGMGAHDE